MLNTPAGVSYPLRPVETGACIILPSAPKIVICCSLRATTASTGTPVGGGKFGLLAALASPPRQRPARTAATAAGDGTPERLLRPPNMNQSTMKNVVTSCASLRTDSSGGMVSPAPAHSLHMSICRITLRRQQQTRAEYDLRYHRQISRNPETLSNSNVILGVPARS